jgi:hypothetical protein
MARVEENVKARNIAEGVAPKPLLSLYSPVLIDHERLVFFDSLLKLTTGITGKTASGLTDLGLTASLKETNVSPLMRTRLARAPRGAERRAA